MIARWRETFTTNQESATEIETTGRSEIAEAEWEIWQDNLLYGVGAGIAPYERVKRKYRQISAHTEFSRLLAEHGLVGLTALLILLASAWRTYQHRPSLADKGWVGTLVAWSRVTMLHAAMRVVAVSFIFGLAFVEWQNGVDN